MSIRELYQNIGSRLDVDEDDKNVQTWTFGPAGLDKKINDARGKEQDFRKKKTTVLAREC